MPPELKDVVQVASGFYHSLALRADGTVMAWGDKRIGGSNVGQFDVPAGLDDVVHISAGHSHSVALKADGTVVAWGWNAYGQTDVPPSLVAAVP
jgi:alpha-tubulin suppressor-like RCC1 family protein